MHPPAFDPAAAARPGSGIFGLPSTRDDAKILLLPVPFDATTSYRPGTAEGPNAIFDASMQVDLFDRRFGRVYERGICMEDEDERIRQWNEEATDLARPLIAEGGADPDDPAQRTTLNRVNSLCQRLNDFVHDHTKAALDRGQVPGTVGGEHSIPLGAIKAVAERYPGVGILHLDAHHDFRPAYEGFSYSHASIMHNVLREVAGVAKLVQIGIRDFSEEEADFANAQKGRVVVHYDDAWAQRQSEGEPFAALARAALNDLPQNVYVSFDVDALDPSLCPHTGTPVPGGLSFNQASLILDLLRSSGRRVVGFDLVEVAPGPETEPELDANVGARLLYKLCGTVTA